MPSDNVIKSTAMPMIIVASLLNNMIDISVYVLIVGFIVMANYLLASNAVKVSEGNERKSHDEKADFRHSIYPQNTIHYAFGKLIGYAGILFSSFFIQDIVGDILPILSSFKTIVFVSEISCMENILKKGYNVDINIISKIVSYLPKAGTHKKKRNAEVHSPKNRRLQK